jgi:hypothetical protein
MTIENSVIGLFARVKTTPTCLQRSLGAARDNNFRLAWLCRTRKHHRVFTAPLEASADTFGDEMTQSGATFLPPQSTPFSEPT